jgi:hypothetical protein
MRGMTQAFYPYFTQSVLPYFGDFTLGCAIFSPLPYKEENKLVKGDSTFILSSIH